MFLDVDGTLIPFGDAAAARSWPAADGGSRVPGAGYRGNPLLDRLNPEHGPALLALGCDLVWATTWMAAANEEIARRIGLPLLPVVDWPEDGEDEPADRGVHWKTRALIS